MQRLFRLSRFEVLWDCPLLAIRNPLLSFVHGIDIALCEVLPARSLQIPEVKCPQNLENVLEIVYVKSLNHMVVLLPSSFPENQSVNHWLLPLAFLAGEM